MKTVAVKSSSKQPKKVVGCTVKQDKGELLLDFFDGKNFVASYYVPGILKNHLKFGRRLSYRGLEAKYEFALETLADVMHMINGDFDGKYTEVTIKTNSEAVRNLYSSIRVKVLYSKNYRFPKI